MFNVNTNVTSLDMAFGFQQEDRKLFIPSDIPAEYRNLNRRSKANDLQAKWFFEGAQASDFPDPKPGINSKQALAHLRSIQVSMDISHEVKVSAVVYLLEEWFDFKD